MPRIAAFVVGCACLVGACFFDADYRSGEVRCSDGKCPSNLTCESNVCVTPKRDAAVVDMAPDSTVDARIPAFTCVDPGLVAATGGTFMGSTASRSNLITASCGGSVMNGPDAVYRITTAMSDQLLVSISGSYPVNAYVLAPCSAAPATPTCLTNTAAAPGNPISVTTTFAGQHFIVVDGINPAQSGTYTLAITVN